MAAACSIAKLTIVTDGQVGNLTPARAIASALQATCTPAPTVREVSQDVADAVNATNGRPVAGGDELLIAAGGFFFSHLTTYVSSGPIAPIYAVQEGDNFDFKKRADDTIVVSDPFGGSHDSQDSFVIQFMRDPSSGSLILNAQGLWQSGTAAAAYYFINVMLPTLATQTKAWYVLKWADANANSMPDLNEFTLVDSGN